MLRSMLAVLALGLALGLNSATAAPAAGASPVAQSTQVTQTAQDSDPFQWLEDIQGKKSLDWVKQRNQQSTHELEAVPVYKPILKRVQEIFDSRDRIPMPGQQGEYIYNFWQDGEHARGIWRRTTRDSYRTASPAWETVLDVDALGKAEGQPWVFKGASGLAPDYRLRMVALSPGGSDAAALREFDAEKKAFVPGGFTLPVAKGDVMWKDENTLWVATDFGQGSLTTSGYPRIIKEWRRGTPLAEARTIFEGSPEDVSVGMESIETPEGIYHLITRGPAFFKEDLYLAAGDRLVRLPIPQDAVSHGIFRDHALFSLRTDWTPGAVAYKQGELLAVALDDLLRGDMRCDVLFEPTERTSLGQVSTTKDRVLITTLDNVRSRLYRIAYADGKWATEEIPLPGIGSARIVGTDPKSSDFYFNYEDFLTPTSLYVVAGAAPEKIKTMPAYFDATGMTVAQYEATSRDGTKIPYFVVMPKGFTADGSRPTLMGGYGGFEIPMLPSYSPTNGAGWLERGGVYALANIRGGGEFGPSWHTAAQRENRIKSFEDFIAVAEDLVARKITSPRHLGIMGGSQGGLLVGGTFTLRPDLFNAVVCQVPLLDMKRFNHLLAGASWMAEYGNPDDPKDWAYMQAWSPYQLVKKDVQYPKVFFWTNMRDDRVHPGHARKMVAKMLATGHPVYYFENIEGGHGSGSTNSQRAMIRALEFSYLWKMLG